MRLPSIEQSLQYLQDAEVRNPGPWVAHSYHVAQGAEIIAGRVEGLDPADAYRLGLLHDIGRRAGVTGMRHVLDGYRFLAEEGFPDAARICLTHSFPVKNVYAGSSEWDCTAAELDEIQRYLDGIRYTDYDRLLMLCDALALPSGFCLIEKRLVDVLMRYRNFNEFTIQKWDAYFELKAYFERKMSVSIYDILPGVKETTFI